MICAIWTFDYILVAVERITKVSFRHDKSAGSDRQAKDVDLAQQAGSGFFFLICRNDSFLWNLLCSLASLFKDVMTALAHSIYDADN